MIDPKDLLKVAATPKEFLRLGVIGFGLLGFLQVAGRPDLVGAEPILGPYVSLGLSLTCLVILEILTYFQRRWHLEDQEKVAEVAVQNGTIPPAKPPE